MQVDEIIINEGFSFNPLEYDGLQKEAELLIEKMKLRRIRWSKQQNAWSNLSEKKLDE